MKAWRDLRQVKIPPRMAKLPRDPRGYPIPVNVLQSGGIVDFRVIDHESTMRLLKTRCCAMCGQPLGTRMAFVGGPSSIAHRLFTDAPVHRECGTYAIKVCPFLAAPKFAYSRHVPSDLPEGLTAVVNEGVSTNRPEFFGLGICEDFELVDYAGQIAIHAAPWKRLEWWAYGHLISEGK